MSFKLNKEINVDNQETSSPDENILGGETPVHIFNTWDELDLNPNLLRGIYAHGFERPSPIQSKSIDPILKGFDLIAQAQSGTGKTASFSIGGLSKIDIDPIARASFEKTMDHFINAAIFNEKDSLKSVSSRIALGKVIGDYEYNPDSPINYNHFRKVEWLFKDENIPVEEIYNKIFEEAKVNL